MRPLNPVLSCVASSGHDNDGLRPFLIATEHATQLVVRCVEFCVFSSLSNRNSTIGHDTQVDFRSEFRGRLARTQLDPELRNTELRHGTQPYSTIVGLQIFCSLGHTFFIFENVYTEYMIITCINKNNLLRNIMK